jgi:catechol 2,3-dioxygenase-like lactoylglutathione lyase family enzyme
MRIYGAFGLALAASTISAPAHADLAPPAAATTANKIVGPVLYVTDMARSLKFYRDTLGMTVRSQFGPADRPNTSLGFDADPKQPSLMLLSDRAGPAPRKIEHGHGYDRLALLVSNLRAVQARLRQAGYTTSEIRQIHDVHLMMMATDPDGYKVELIDSQPAG